MDFEVGASYVRQCYLRSIFPIIATRGVAKLSALPKVTIFPPPVPYYLMSDQCLKGDF